MDLTTAVSVFKKRNLKEIYEEIREVYLADKRPWVIGYSGGKDSTTALQLVWYAISELPESKRDKPIYVISSNTLVESPILLKYVVDIHKKINAAAEQNNLPFQAIQIRPKITETFWVNLIGKGYPAPTRMFRWCTSRMKISPADKFILDKVSDYGEVLLILGVRKAESATRAQVMSLHKIKDSLLSRHSKFLGAFVYTPVEDFTVDDVWSYLLQKKSPWGADNRELLTLYTDKSSGECPLVVDKSTPSCGGSRFGCWTCTVVNKDKSMQNLIESGEDWMKPLLEIRDFLFETTDPEKKSEFRDYRGINGNVRFKSDGSGEISLGPYKPHFRKLMLRKVLEAQKLIEQKNKAADFQAILPEEIHEIRKIWITKMGDWEDSVPKIYREVMGEDLNWTRDDATAFSHAENKILEDICKKHKLPVDLLTRLLDVEKQTQGMTRRASVYSKLDSVLKREWRSEEEIRSLQKKGV